MKCLLLWIFLIVSSVGVAARNHPTHAPLKSHLAYKNNTLHLHTELAAEPKLGEEAFLKIETRNAIDHSIAEINDAIEVVLWMPSMGHGSAPTRLARVLDASGNPVPGQYLARNLHFIMAGIWDVRITLTDAHGKQETQKFTVELEGKHHSH